jgi:hypothetical protein
LLRLRQKQVLDYTEAYIILPNESAFWIPDAGANKDTQARFESEEYLNANKVPVKRIPAPTLSITHKYLTLLADLS